MNWEDVRDGRAATDLFRWVGEPSRDLETEAVEADWTVWLLDTSAVETADDFYSEVRAAWGLPPWFGDNLDALFDALRDAVAGPSVLIWDGSRAVEQIGGSLAADVVRVLRDTIADAGAFAVILRDDPLADVIRTLE
jgi:RNAse (barnase) inhibitor barstar